MIYDNIKRLCDERGITIQALEIRAGLGNGVIGKWREHDPGVFYLKKAADALGVTVDELLTEVES